VIAAGDQAVNVRIGGANLTIAGSGVLLSPTWYR
jgi:hypothetical protein